MKLVYINNQATRIRPVNYELCDQCNKNNVSCMNGDEVCLPLEMWVQLNEEKSIIGKLEMLDNVQEYLG